MSDAEDEQDDDTEDYPIEPRAVAIAHKILDAFPDLCIRPPDPAAKDYWTKRMAMQQEQAQELGEIIESFARLIRDGGPQ